MPRLSLYKPEKGNDYKFIDRQASEMFQVGGTDVYLHKYLGPKTDEQNQRDPNASTIDQPKILSNNVANIQDLLFLENRDRKYDSEIYRIRGIYNVQNIDFNLSQFGLFIDNDTLFMTVHINDFIKYIGRKPISGDVIELPHLRDNFALNDFDVGLPRYYVIEDVGRASEGFSATWYPHLYRLKVKKITDAQQFSDIFNQAAKDANGDDIAGTTLKDLLSTYNQEISINNAVVQQAELDAPKSGYETRQFYTLAADANTGKTVLETVDSGSLLASNSSTTVKASAVNGVAQRSGYTGYLTGDGFPVNGYDFGFGIQFPANPADNDFFLRADFFPNRLFRFDGKQAAWIAVEDNVRMNMTNNNSRSTQKTGFINNSAYMYTDALTNGGGFATLELEDFVIDTSLDYDANYLAKYIVLKFDSVSLEYAVEDYLDPMITSYSYMNPNTGIFSNNVRITLPLIPDKDNVPQQQTIPYAGQWSITLYNVRNAQKSSLSKALKYKPEADL
jgi:hypothetical protein